jgi:hypothetical protein
VLREMLAIGVALDDSGKTIFCRIAKAATKCPAHPCVERE